MSTNPVVRGITHVWGTTDVEIGALLNQIANSFTKRKGSGKTEVKDGKGNTVSVIYYDKTVSVAFEALIAVSGGLAQPESGDIIALHSGTDTTINYLVDDSTLNYRTATVLAISVNATYYPDVALA